MNERLVALGRRFARVATRAVVARPWLWRLFRRPLRAQFEWLAPSWEGRRGPAHLIALDAALDRLDETPRRILDVGTGTGLAARHLARRYPEAEVIGVDLSPKMVEEARRILPAELAGRVRFDAGDAAALPYADAEFDLVTLVAAIPFFAELARVTTPGGAVLLVFPSGAETPIYAPPDVLEERLVKVGFAGVEELAADGGTAVLARR